MTPPSPPEIEFMMRIAELQRRIDRDARAAVWRTIGALLVAFCLGAAAAHIIWR
jgi:hypothetical protein